MMVKHMIICDYCNNDCSDFYFIVDIVNHKTFANYGKHICFDCAKKGVKFDVNES